MPFKGLSRHVVEIEALLQASPGTRVIIDHWGFFLQPATGFGADRTFDEESWANLLRLSSHKQVHVKLSALFRVAADPWPFESLSDRFKAPLDAFGSERLLWRSRSGLFGKTCPSSSATTCYRARQTASSASV